MKEFNAAEEMEIYEAAIEHWGPEVQIDKAIEELCELTTALIKFQNKKHTPWESEYEKLVGAVNEERADVTIMINQLDLIFGDNTEMEIQKLTKLQNRIR